MEEKPISKLARTSLILGVFPLLITNITGIVLAITALKRIKLYGLRGKAMAITGIISNIIISLLLVLSFSTPRNTYHGMAGRETKAVQTLRQLVKAEKIWKQNDYDRNGINDYWTYDVSCFYRLHYKDDTSLLPVEIARADARKAPFDFPTEIELMEEYSWSSGGYYGYLFQSMMTDENGIPYNQNPVGTNKTLATNTHKFAFMAYPDAYAISGINTFIINEKGTIYANDTGSDANKIILTWPGKDPTTVTGPVGRLWRVAD